ncbi:DUF637 domain-containing protein, partial [Photorhabdus bodei]|uniref:DUF637 domain-containing protein n=1 Tax=Photorhabdus bodei TaxID=2029681 RepID=UPI001E4C6DC3
EVKTGQITIGGKGLDGKATDYVDIISRATELNGKIQANNLSLTQGANRISLKDGTVKPVAGEGAKPQLAVDTKALGGMYANKIRLVATEEGVGVNLKNLISDQRDITLNANGKIELGNIKAKTDLNIVGKETHIAPNINVQAGRDIILENITLDNKGSVTSGRNMRIFGDTVRNNGDKALLQANNNMWIQKDAQGNKGHLIENKSATIKTVKGDLVVRTQKLNNTRDVFVVKNKELIPDSTDKNLIINETKTCDFGDPVIHEAALITPLPDKWFGRVDFGRDNTTDGGIHINHARTETINSDSKQPGVIASGKSIYINSDELLNFVSKMSAGKDIFLTGINFINESKITGVLNNYIVYTEKETEGSVSSRGDVYIRTDFDRSGNVKTWEDESNIIEPASVVAAGNLVADFKDNINIRTPPPYDINEMSQITVAGGYDALSAKNIVLNSGKINNNNIIKANNNITILATDAVTLNTGEVISGGDVSMIAANNIDVLQSKIKGKNITVISRNADLKLQSNETVGYFNHDGNRIISRIEATGDLLLNAGKNIIFRDIFLTKSDNITLTANNDITIDNNNAVLLSHKRIGSIISFIKEQELFNNMLSKVGKLDAKSSIVINAGGNLSAKSIRFSAEKDINLTSAKSIDLAPRELSPSLSKLFPSSRSGELSSQLTAGNNISVISGTDINGKAVQIQANGNVLLSSGRNITLLPLLYSAIAYNDDDRPEHYDEHKDDRNYGTQIRGTKKLTMAANGAITTVGSKLLSDGDITITSGGDIRFESARNHFYKDRADYFKDNSITETYTQQSTELTSGGVLTVLSNGSILFQATKLAAKGAMDIAAKGGYLYAQAMEESNHYENTETSRNWYGRKKTAKRTRHDVTNKVTEFTAGGDINLLSRDDSTYEASQIATNKNAKLTSTHGKVNFKAVKNTAFEQTITYSKGFYIKQRDKGYTEDKWVLPSIHIGGKLTVEAAKGVSADIKAKNGQSLQNVLTVLGNTPETAWLKGLNENKDTQWNVVKDAYDSWDHKSQHLNPVVSAVIAIAAAAATAGSSLAASVASYAGNSVAGGALTAGMSSLTAQAAVAIVDNQGDLSKALKVLGSSDTVKSTITSMALGGALAGFDNVMGWDKAANGAQIDPAKATLPKLSNGDWSKVAQRIAGQSIISSSLGTTINGGSFKDNFTTALLANIGSQINAEGAGLIGANGQVLDLPGKAISHAAVSALAAEIGGGDAKGAAAGALAAELAAITLDKTFNDPMKIQAGGKIIGSVAGAIATNSAKGANSGANAGEIVILFNHLNSMNAYNLVRELQEANKQGTPTEAIWNKYNKLSATQRAEMLSHCAGNGGLCTLTYQAEMEGGIKTADAISGLRWMFGLSEEDSHRISQFVTTENQNDLGLLYNSLPAWEKGALIAKEAVESAGIGGAIGGKASVASIVGKNKQPYQPNNGTEGKSEARKGTIVSTNNVHSSLKLGETKVVNEVNMTRVGRWMSHDELAQMQSSGKIVQGGGGQTFISTNGASDFKGTAPKGSVYVEFDVPANSLLKGGKDGWFKMIGPDASKSQQFLLNKQSGQQLPEIKNITIVDIK